MSAAPLRWGRKTYRFPLFSNDFSTFVPSPLLDLYPAGGVPHLPEYATATVPHGNLPVPELLPSPLERSPDSPWGARKVRASITSMGRFSLPPPALRPPPSAFASCIEASSVRGSAVGPAWLDRSCPTPPLGFQRFLESYQVTFEPLRVCACVSCFMFSCLFSCLYMCLCVFVLFFSFSFCICSCSCSCFCLYLFLFVIVFLFVCVYTLSPTRIVSRPFALNSLRND